MFRVGGSGGGALCFLMLLTFCSTASVVDPWDAVRMAEASQKLWKFDELVIIRNSKASKHHYSLSA
jgi:hypothetical protein